MKLRQALMQRRIRKAKIAKFTRTYMYITRLLLKMGFNIPKNPANSEMPRCMQGQHGLFLGSEKIGPGIVGFLHCCSNCFGWEEAGRYFKQTGKLPPIDPKGKLMVRCRVDEEPKYGVYKPVILYPEYTKPTNKPFFTLVPKDISIIIRNFILGKKKKKNGHWPPHPS